LDILGSEGFNHTVYLLSFSRKANFHKKFAQPNIQRIALEGKSTDVRTKCVHIESIATIHHKTMKSYRSMVYENLTLRLAPLQYQPC